MLLLLHLTRVEYGGSKAINFAIPYSAIVSKKRFISKKELFKTYYPTFAEKKKKK